MLQPAVLQLSGAAAAVAIVVALLYAYVPAPELDLSAFNEWYASGDGSANAVVLSTLALALGVFAAALAYYYKHKLGKFKKGCTDVGAGSAGAKADVGRQPAVSRGFRRCAACGMEQEQMDSCARCKAVFFCSRECQKKAWKWHKNECQDPVTTTQEDTTPSLNGKSGKSSKDVARQAQVTKELSDATEAMANGHPKMARRHAEQCARVAKKLQLHAPHGEALQILGQACLQLDDKQAADQAYISMVELGQDARDPALEGTGLIGRGCVACRRDGEAAAITFHEQAIKLVRHCQDKLREDIVSMEASARANRGRCLIGMGRASDAVHELRQVVSLRRLSAAASVCAERKRQLGNALISLAASLRTVDDAGSQEEVRQLLNEALSEAKQSGDVQTQVAARAGLNSLPG